MGSPEGFFPIGTGILHSLSTSLTDIIEINFKIEGFVLTDTLIDIIPTELL